MTTVQGLLDGQFTIGIEEEFQIVDAETRELRSYVSQILEEGRQSAILRERVRPEMHQSVVETGTGICRDINQARDEICELRGSLKTLAEKGGMRIVAAGTHPFSDWKKQEITDGERYKGIVEDLQDVARANLIFGLHVHVGIKDKEVAMALTNQVRYFLPHILAISTSSPFWLGRPSGLKSIRTEIFKRFPRTGIPGHFDSYGKFQRFVDTLVKTGCIDNAKKIWWDVRPHPFFDTVEVRVCDMTTRVDDTLAIAALIQALMGKLYLLYRRNWAFREYSRELIEENKWRAVRYGIDGQLIDFGKQEQVPVRHLVGELLDFVEEAAVIFHSQAALERIRGILKEGTSADRQLAVFAKTGSYQAVVDELIVQSSLGL
ncbi:carboxylate-amine ligase [Chondromyces crocatus]|uniref:Putative glutamate--cysteine ligase 2 n=1 Tax=Chondromyces crocatus TaxID=52 RepID=A0A0K1EHV9_CHOCO|nr:carboxylate-amine ligase [Chondromyces crocatus]AKT40445.1 carboxylate-amine ligase [Chondromyces crocatus]